MIELCCNTYQLTLQWALANTFGVVLQTIYNALNNSWVPFYYEYTRNNETDKIVYHSKNYIELFTVISIGFILMAKEVFHIYAKQSFWEGTDLIPLFSLGHYFVFLYSFPVNYEFYYKRTKTIAMGTTLAALCNIVLNCALIKYWGIQGAVVATVISHGLQFLFHFICAKRIKSNEFPFKLVQFVPGLLAVCATGIFYWFMRDYWILRWAVAISLGLFIAIKIVRRRDIF